MSKKLSGLDWSQHKALGAELFEMRSRLLSLVMGLSHAYGVSSKVSKRTGKAQAAVDDLRSALDDVVGRDCPGKTDPELNHCYFPGPDAKTVS
jgi:hypothetical protein